MTPEERAEFIQEVAAATRERSTDKKLSEDEQRWVRMAIQREAQSIELRRAIIEKSLTSLIWAGIVGIGYMILAWATNHGYKP